jgi:hypothetical protein
MNLATAQKLSQLVMNGKGLIEQGEYVPVTIYAEVDEDGDPILVKMSQENREID